MVYRYTFGKPFETDAVTAFAGEDKDAGSSGFHEVAMAEALKEYAGITWDKKETTAMVFELQLDEGEVVYGLGESIRGINKRGWVYESKCSDDPNHTESKRSLYGAHNFLMTENEGFFVDYPGRVIFDVGYLDADKLIITVCSTDFYFYRISASGDTKSERLYSIVRQFREIIGAGYIPPRWSLGYQQSRWSYADYKEVEEVVDNFRSRNIPIDAVYLDIDYMKDYKDFTVDDERFPDFKNFVERMKAEHIHLVPIIDAGVKIEEGYELYDEGVKNGYFCKDADGKDFVAGVWPGKVHFPDFLNADSRKWFGEHYSKLVDLGIDGFWNDMNEPAIFYSQKHLDEVFEKIEEYKKKNLDIQSFFEFRGLVEGISNNDDDYRNIFHNATQPGGDELVCHDGVHNLYGYNMTRSAREAFDRLYPDKEILLFSRASYVGMHRYGGIWFGDNHSWFSHVLMSLQMLPGLNMCGFMYIGPDLGGFNDSVTEELLIRFTQFSAFVPLMRNHSAAGTRRQEPYRFPKWQTLKRIIEFRYGIIPYLYNSLVKAVKNNTLMYIPLGFEHPDDEYAVAVNDQLYVGDSIMICPVYTQNAIGRSVYLPENMTLVRITKDGYETEDYGKGHHFVKIPLEELVFFVRQGAKIKLYSSAQYVDGIDRDSYVVIAGPKGEKSE